MEMTRPPWQPPAKVVSHAGEPLEPDALFFATPPPEIGEVLTAQTSLKKDKQPLEPHTRALLIVLAGLGGLGLVQWLCGMAGLEGPARQWSSLSVAALAALIAWWATRFSHQLSYVGKNGVVVLKRVGSSGGVSTEKILLFKDARELRTKEVQVFNTGFYVGLGYNYRWMDGNAKESFVLSGSVDTPSLSMEPVPPGPKDLYHLAVSAERAWSMRLLDLAQAELEKNGWLQFNLDSGQFVRVGSGFIEICLGDKTVRSSSDDIAEIGIGNGVFTIRRKDATSGFLGLFEDGVFTFDYAEMANARLFLIAVEELAGFKFD